MIIDHCSWNSPGADPYRGEPSAAVYSYSDIPRSVQDALAERMKRQKFDDIATIGRDAISGGREYTGLRDMHFGRGKVCRTVDRSGWAADALEIGLVYCEAEHCLIVPTVCRNVSRVTRAPASAFVEPGQPTAMSTGGGQTAYTNTFAAPEPAAPQLALIELTVEATDGWPMLPPLWASWTPGPTPPVPEAPGWARMLAGLAALVVLFVRRRR